MIFWLKSLSQLLNKYFKSTVLNCKAKKLHKPQAKNVGGLSDFAKWKNCKITRQKISEWFESKQVQEKTAQNWKTLKVDLQSKKWVVVSWRIKRLKFYRDPSNEKKTYFRLFFFLLLQKEMKSISNEKENSHQNSCLYLLRKTKLLGQESEKIQKSARHLLIFECQKHFWFENEDGEELGTQR